MIRHIDMFMPPKSQYGVLHHLTRKFNEALLRAGIESRILVADRSDPKPFLESLFDYKPDLTLSFNGLLPDKNGTFFCDLIKIPHVACLVDSPIHFLQLKGSPYSIATCPDRDGRDFFRGMGFQNVLFMPHGVEKELCEIELSDEREYDVAMFASCDDCEKRRDKWNEMFSPLVCQAMEKACEVTLSDNKTSFISAFVEALDTVSKDRKGVVPADLDLILALNELEAYIKSVDRIEAIKSIKNAKVDVFGSGDWHKYVGDISNVTIHEAIPYEDVIERMQRTKIVLNSFPWAKYGAHERLFTAMALGACVITSDNLFMREFFQDGEDVLLYQHGKWDDLNQKIETYLNDHDLRSKMTRRAREKVLEHHTWDHRVKDLLDSLPPILQKITEVTAI